VALLVIGGAILVLVQYHRRKVQPAQQRLAIAALIAMGLVYYVRLTVVGALAGARAAIEKKSISLDYTGGPITSEVEMGITLLLGLVGLAILITGRTSSHGPRSMAS
jgi:high-affinity nickel permease